MSLTLSNADITYYTINGINARYKLLFKANEEKEKQIQALRQCIEEQNNRKQALEQQLADTLAQISAYEQQIRTLQDAIHNNIGASKIEQPSSVGEIPEQQTIADEVVEEQVSKEEISESQTSPNGIAEEDFIQEEKPVFPDEIEENSNTSPMEEPTENENRQTIGTQPKPSGAQMSSAAGANLLPPVTDIRKAMSIADKFLFQRELFGGDMEKMLNTIEKLNKMTSLEQAAEYLRNKFNWDTGSQTYELFYNLLKRRFQ